MLLGARTAMWGGKSLPYDAEVQWLEMDNSKSQYIDTGVPASSLVDFSFWFSRDGDSSYFVPLFGCYKDGSYLGVQHTSGSSPYSVKVWRGSSSKSRSIGESSSSWQGTVSESNGVFSFGGDSLEIQSSAFSGQDNIWLGHVNGIIFMIGNKKKIGFCKLWENGVLVRDFIPVVDLNGVACMYDRVSQSFFYNQGSGSFVTGPKV